MFARRIEEAGLNLEWTLPGKEVHSQHEPYNRPFYVNMLSHIDKKRTSNLSLVPLLFGALLLYTVL